MVVLGYILCWLKLNMMKRISLFLFLAFVFSNCGFFRGNPYTNTPTTGHATIATDETFKPIIEAELDVFKAIYGYTEFKSTYVPEIDAFAQLMNGDVQLIIASRPLSKEEVALFHQKKIYPRQTKVATDAIALIVSKQSSDTLVTINQIKELLTGKITSWNQINPTSKSGKISAVFDNQKSSIINYLVDSICGGQLVKTNVFALDYNKDVIEYTSTHPGVLGFIGASWISNDNDSTHLSFHKKIKVCSVSDNSRPNAENSYKPYQAYMAEHIYPLTRDIYIINAEPRNGLATGFSAFLASDKGQRIILKSGILPAIAPTRVVKTRKDF
jgi:phosphate transport system substrate-binding protein